MKTAVCLFVSIVCLSTFVWAQTSSPNPQNSPVAVLAPPSLQTQIDGAWKDVRIAQLQFALAVQQALGGMEKGTYYDFNQQKFFRPAEPPKTSVKTGPREAIPEKKQ
jgi:hypothetical protein